jgi:hypothetical protein
MPKTSTALKSTALIALALIAGCTAASPLESNVIARARLDPQTAPEYFMRRIEAGATPAEQAIYMYGSGLAHEKTGHIREAIDDYICADLLGEPRAKLALKRLRPLKNTD